MSAGKSTVSSLRHRLTLQCEVRMADGAGGYIRSWQNIADLWGEITSFSSNSGSAKGAGKEVLFAGQLQAEITHRIVLRYRERVTADMRLVYEGRVFNIRSVMNSSEDRQTLELMVQEGVGGFNFPPLPWERAGVRDIHSLRVC